VVPARLASWPGFLRLYFRPAIRSAKEDGRSKLQSVCRLPMSRVSGNLAMSV
jgi:hypothetical protein